MYDEVNEPLGYHPAPPGRAATGWKIVAGFAASAALAAVMASHFLSWRGPPPREQNCVAAKAAPPILPTAAAKIDPAPVASVSPERALSMAPASRSGGPSAPIPLIIDVQRALAERAGPQTPEPDIGGRAAPPIRAMKQPAGPSGEVPMFQ
jgi:hypothetical protein